MLKKDDKVFLRLPREDSPTKRVLRPGIVIEPESDAYLIQLEELCPGIEESTDAFLHFEVARKFLQQSASVVQKGLEEPLVIVAQLHGTPVSAEGRQSFRVSCLGSNIKATVADETACEVVDVSATGFAFYGRGDYEIGRRVQVTISYEGKEHKGQGTIQSLRRMTPRMLRYGVHCSDGTGDTLARSLAAINVAVQSEQLRRLARKS